jgi:hypothetical protein
MIYAPVAQHLEILGEVAARVAQRIARFRGPQMSLENISNSWILGFERKNLIS